MAKRPTLDEVARRAGVSRMTVSNTYGRPQIVKPSTRALVLEVARELGYPGPSPAARSLRRGLSEVIGVVVADSLPYLFNDPGAAAMMQGMATEASSRDLALQVIHAEGPSAAGKVRGAIVDGWVVFGLARNHPAALAVAGTGRPLATVAGERIPGHPTVVSDYALAGSLVVDHLLGLGHHDFVLIAPSMSSPIWAGRMDAYRTALPPQHQAAIRIVECGENSRQAGRRVGSSLFHGRVPASGLAVLAATDVLALGLLDVARGLGIRVPERMSIVGFDDIDEAAASSPPLTTVRQDLQAQGRLAVQLATGQTRRNRLLHALPVELVVRGSTGPPGRGR